MTADVKKALDESYKLKDKVAYGKDGGLILEVRLPAPTPAHRKLMHFTRQMFMKMSKAVEAFTDDEPADEGKTYTSEEREQGVRQSLPLLDFDLLEEWYKSAIELKALKTAGVPFKEVYDKLSEEDFYGIIAKYLVVFTMR